MSKKKEPLFNAGRPNPGLAGIPLRLGSSGSAPELSRIVAAARIIGVPVTYENDDGYECEIVAASDVGANGELAYVASSAKELKDYVSVSFKFVVRDGSARETSSEIESYNPFFGCDVHFLEWFGNIAILIYREKHCTYIAAGSLEVGARYVRIADNWIIKGNQLGYMEYKEAQVKRLLLPQLEELQPISETEAVLQALCPQKYW